MYDQFTSIYIYPENSNSNIIAAYYTFKINSNIYVIMIA